MFVVDGWALGCEHFTTYEEACAAVRMCESLYDEAKFQLQGKFGTFWKIVEDRGDGTPVKVVKRGRIGVHVPDYTGN